MLKKKFSIYIKFKVKVQKWFFFLTEFEICSYSSLYHVTHKFFHICVHVLMAFNFSFFTSEKILYVYSSVSFRKNKEIHCERFTSILVLKPKPVFLLFLQIEKKIFLKIFQKNNFSSYFVLLVSRYNQRLFPAHILIKS